MKNNRQNSPNKRQGEDNRKPTQLKTIFYFLQDHIATASMITEATGIPQKNICRYKRDLEKVGALWEIEKKTCEKTGFKAWYLTTNPDLIPTNDQLSFF